jgi:hypothetical protein
MARFVFCLVNGEPFRLEISSETHAILREACFKTKHPLQNVLAPAFKKYGKREDSILKYIKKDLAKQYKRP